jgi:hypothetical protein
VFDELLKDWRIRHHIRKVAFEANRQLYYDPSIENPYNGHTLILPPPELLDEIGRLDGFKSFPIGLEKFENGHGDPFNALFLYQAPNLREIKFVNYGPEADLHQFLTASVDLVSPPILTRLRTVNLEHWDTEGGMSLDWVLAFMRFPSVRTINGHMIEAGQDFEFKLGPKSNVTALNFTYSCIELGAFDQLIGLTQNLECFSYEHGGVIVGDEECDPYGMVAVLLNHAGHSLDTLKISYGDEDDVSSCKLF